MAVENVLEKLRVEMAVENVLEKLRVEMAVESVLEKFRTSTIRKEFIFIFCRKTR